MNLKRTLIIGGLILCEGMLLMYLCTDRNLRMYFAIVILLIHTIAEVYLPQYSSRFVRLWLYGSIGHIIFRDILPFLFITGDSSLQSCVVIWSVLIFGRLLIHYLHLNHVFVTHGEKGGGMDPILYIFPFLFQYQYITVDQLPKDMNVDNLVTMSRVTYEIDNDFGDHSDEDDEIPNDSNQIHSGELLDMSSQAHRNYQQIPAQSSELDVFFQPNSNMNTNTNTNTKIHQPSSTQPQQRRHIGNQFKSSEYSSMSTMEELISQEKYTKPRGLNWLRNVLWCSYQSQYRFTLIFLIALQLSLYQMSIKDTHTISLHRGLDVLSLLNLTGNTLYSLLIYTYLKNSYLTLLCYLLFWINIWDFLVSLAISFLIFGLAKGGLSDRTDYMKRLKSDPKENDSYGSSSVTYGDIESQSYTPPTTYVMFRGSNSQ